MRERSPEEWRRARRLLEELRDAPRAEQERALEQVEEQTARDVRGLLRADATTSAVIDRDAPDLHLEGLRLEQRESLCGAVVGSYRLDEFVGEGGTATVFRAERVDPGEPPVAAVKVLKPGILSKETIARFRLEHDAGRGLRHPGLPRVLGAAEVRGRPCLITQFVDGVPIDLYCEERALDRADRLRLFVQVCRAVHHAHRHLVVHRDLKPNNVLVDTSGQPHVLDFGIAKLLDASLDPGWTELYGRGPLTPGFASPEQIRGEPVSTATDVYSLGVVLYTLLVGASPYRTEPGDRAALERAVLEDAPRPPSEVGVTPLPRDLALIVMRSLEKRPTDRYPSVEHFADDMERFLEHRPVRARRAAAHVAVAKWARRNPWLVGGLVVMLSLLVGGWVGASQSLQRVRASESMAWQAHANAVQSTNLLAGLIERIGAAQLQDDAEFEALVEETERYLPELVDAPEAEARLRIALGRARFASGATGPAERHIVRALSLGRSTVGMNWRDVDRCLRLLVEILEASRPTAALAYARDRVALVREHLGEESEELDEAREVVRRLEPGR